MDRMRADLAKRAKPMGGEVNQPPPEPAPSTPPSGEPPPPPTPGQEPSPEPGTTPAQPPEPATPPADPKAKTNPWKLVDQYKSRLAELEKAQAEAKTATLAEQQRKEYEDKLAELAKRNTTLEEEMRFTDYTKTDEFQKKHMLPYQQAWERAAKELQEIGVRDGEDVRPAKLEDLMALVQMPLGQARAVADEKFGAFADDIMQHRKDIVTLFQQQQDAIKDARENGTKVMKERQEALQRQTAERRAEIKRVWDEELTKVASDERYSRYVKPSDGDEEGNTRLTNGYEFVSKALSLNPDDPRLSSEQRADVVRMHAALNHRAAAFGKLTLMVERLEAEKKALEGELSKFKSSTPTTGGGAPQSQQQPTYTKASDQVFAALRAKAKPI